MQCGMRYFILFFIKFISPNLVVIGTPSIFLIAQSSMHTDLTRVALYDELLACVTDQHLVSDTDSVQAASIEYNTSAKHDYESMLKSLIFNFR